MFWGLAVLISLMSLLLASSLALLSKLPRPVAKYHASTMNAMDVATITGNHLGLIEFILF